MSVKDYSLKLTQLARYAPHVVPDSRSRISKFMSRVSDSVVKQCKTMILIKEMNVSRLMVHAQLIEEKKLKKKEKENKRARNGSFNFNQPKSEGGKHS